MIYTITSFVWDKRKEETEGDESLFHHGLHWIPSQLLPSLMDEIWWVCSLRQCVYFRTGCGGVLVEQRRQEESRKKNRDKQSVPDLDNDDQVLSTGGQVRTWPEWRTSWWALATVSKDREPVSWPEHHFVCWLCVVFVFSSLGVCVKEKVWACSQNTWLGRKGRLILILPNTQLSYRPLAVEAMRDISLCAEWKRNDYFP